MSTNRRDFLRNSSGILLGLSAGLHLPVISMKDDHNKPVDARQYLSEILYTRQEVDEWLAGSAFPFSKYHSGYGWLLNNARFRDGIDNSWSIYTYMGENGPRLIGNYHDVPCRINTYGNSFTQCHQVSDHETWQEILAAHLQEPVRNFGVGGWSVYQAYLRMRDEEERTPAEYIVFNVYEDDHKRNLDAWRNIRVRKHPQHIEAPLPYIKVNLKDGTFSEQKNPCPTRESLYDLCDPDKAFYLFGNDFALRIMLAHRNAESENPDAAYDDLMTLSRTHGIDTRIDESRTVAAEAEKLHSQAALFSSQKILKKIADYITSNNKKILFVLSYSPKTIAQFYETGIRSDQPFIESLISHGFPYIDLMAAHIEDAKKFDLGIKDYLSQYFIGHYNPRGNFFCAFALKDKLLELLDPKPAAYRE